MSILIKHPSARVALPDGTIVEIRPVHPDDKPLLERGFERLSPRARFFRFLSPASSLTKSQLAYLSELDFHDHVAWGVILDGTPVAVGRFVRFEDDHNAADVAVTVLDDYQRRGIGRLILRTLGVSARARGVGTFHFDVLAENHAMLGLLEACGAVRVSGDDVVHLVMEVARLAPPSVVEGDMLMLLERAFESASGTD